MILNNARAYVCVCGLLDEMIQDSRFFITPYIIQYIEYIIKIKKVKNHDRPNSK